MDAEYRISDELLDGDVDLAALIASEMPFGDAGAGDVTAGGASSSSSVAEYRQLWRRSDAKPARAPTKSLSPSVDETKKTAAPRPRMTPDEKVEKHRMIVRRSYYQKKELKASLRSEISALEARYQQLVSDTAQLQLFHGQQHHDASPSSDSDSDASGSGGREFATVVAGGFHCATCKQVQSMRRQYTELSIAKEALLRERDALEGQLQQHHGFQDKLDQFMLRDLQIDSGTGRHPPTSKSDNIEAITVLTPEFPVSFRPLTEEECFRVIGTALRAVRSQTTASADFHDVGSLPIMGWNRKRTYGARASFSLLKTFPTQEARNLWNQTWRLYTETRLFEQLYSGTVNMKFHILQRVNENNVLFCRTLKTEKLRIRSVTIFLFARFQVDGKYFILFRSIDKDRVQADHPEDAILGMFSWLSFTDHEAQDEAEMGDGDEGAAAPASPHCEVEFGGTVPSAAVADTDFWMMEFLSYLLRLENCAIGPVFQVLH